MNDEEKDIDTLNLFLELLNKEDKSLLEKFLQDDFYKNRFPKALESLMNRYEEKNARISYLEELIDTMETYYSITVEDLENYIKNDK